MPSKQVILTIAPDEDAYQGKMYCLEKQKEEWKIVKEIDPVYFGKKGLAKGKGIIDLKTRSNQEKIEGDLKSPIGIFSLIKAFGHRKQESLPTLKFPYEEITLFHEAIDDSHSKYYNRIVDSRKIGDRDWSSSEKMGEIDLYDLGIEVGHNFESPEAGKGSAIFIHLSREGSNGTHGCTALDGHNLQEIICWLDETSYPLLVQVTQDLLKR